MDVVCTGCTQTLASRAPKVHAKYKIFLQQQQKNTANNNSKQLHPTTTASKRETIKVNRVDCLDLIGHVRLMIGMYE
jgi:hypothetical protein